MIRRLLVAPDGRLALVWRLAIFFLLSTQVVIIVSGYAGLAVLAVVYGETITEVPSIDTATEGGPARLLRSALVSSLSIASMLALTYLFRRWIDRRPWSGIALPTLSRRRVAELLGGFLLGVVMVATIFAIEWAAGWVSVVGFETSTSGFVGALSFLAAGLLTFIAVGFSEELVFRGYLFQNLGERLPIWAPTLLLGLVFAFIHYGNEGSTLAFMVGVAIGGVFLVLTRLLTGSLWFAIGWHAAYNFMLVAVFNSSSATDRGAYGHSLVHVEPWIQDDLVTIGVVVLVTAAAAVLFTRQHGASGWTARLNEDGSLTSGEARDRPEKLDRR